MLRSGIGRSADDNMEGLTGLKDLGVRDLTYRLAFLACTVEPVEALRFGNKVRGSHALSTINTSIFLVDAERLRPGRGGLERRVDPELLYAVGLVTTKSD